MKFKQKLNKTETKIFKCWNYHKKNQAFNRSIEACTTRCKAQWWMSRDGELTRVILQECDKSNYPYEGTQEHICKSANHFNRSYEPKVNGSKMHGAVHICTCTGDFCNAENNLKRSLTKYNAIDNTPYKLTTSKQEFITRFNPSTDFSWISTCAVAIAVVLFLITILLCCLRKVHRSSVRLPRFLCMVFKSSSKRNSSKHRKGSQKLDGNLLTDDSENSCSDFGTRSSSNSDVFEDVDFVVNTNHLVGKGKFGSVYMADHHDKSTLFCCKVAKDRSSSSTVENEIKVLQMLCAFNHNSVVKYFGRIPTEMAETNVGFVMEYCAMGSLKTFLSRNTIEEGLCLSFIRDLACGVAFLHAWDVREPQKLAVAHRDLCSANLLIRKDMTLAIADFGVSKVLNEAEENRYSSKVEHLAAEGTPYYIAPEMLNLSADLTDIGSALKQADVYSMSLVFWETINRCKFFFDLKTQSVPEHSLPFANVINSIAELKVHVVDKGMRPKFSFIDEKDYERDLRINLNKAGTRKEIITKCLLTTIVEGWDKDEDARISASCVFDRIAFLIQQLELCQSHLFYSLETCV